jgi:hypothetical protein
MYTLNTVDAAENARGAAANAYYRNRELACTYTREQQCLAQRVLDVLQLGYAYAQAYTNYRKKFIAVKLTGVMVKDKRLAREAMQCMQDRGYKVETTPQGTIIRIPR